jgi:lysozyme family protein
MSRFAICLAETLKWEGEWSNHKDDPGGPTRGVIQRVYDAYRKGQGLPAQTVRKISDDELHAIYHDNYWRLVRGDELPPGVDLAVFDYGVNSGPSRSIKYLQSVLGVPQDGNMGPVTMQRVAEADPDDIIRDLMQARRGFLRQIKTFRTFGKGWLRRCDGIEKAALAMIGHKVTPVEPDGEPDEISAAQGRATDEPPKPAPVGAVSGGAALGTGAGLALPSLPAPPDLSPVTAWQSFGDTVGGLLTWMTAAPLKVGLVVGAVALLGWGLPMIARRFQ